MVRAFQFIKLLLVFCLASMPAAGEELLVPLSFSGTYVFTLSGIPFGKINLQLTQDKVRYSAVSDVKTVGIARMFVEHDSHTTSEGWGRDFLYDAVDYKSNYSTRGKPKTAQFSKKDGVMFADKVTPPDDRKNRPAVALTDKSKAFDPLALAAGIRVALARVLQNDSKKFSLDYYDGRRLTRATFSYEGEKNIRIKGVKYPAYAVNATRTPLAGFTDKELKRMQEPEPTLTIYFSRDERLVPLRLDVMIGMLLASATLKM